MNRLAVIFPGIGYNFDRPLLHFGIEWAAERGYEVRKVPYSGFPPKIRGSKERMKESLDIAWRQTQEMLADVRWDQYEDLVFISKSIGTIVAAKEAAECVMAANDGNNHAEEEKNGGGKNGAGAADHTGGIAGICTLPRQILFTPFPETFEILQGISGNSNSDAAGNYRYNSANAIAFHGTGDPWMDNEKVIRAAESAGIPMELYEGANHSLETGNTIRDLTILSEVFAAIQGTGW